MTDTADLVKELRADALFLAANDLDRAKETAPWKAAAALEATQARADKLEEELVEAKRERDAYKSSRWHWKQTAVRFAERSNERLARAEAAEEVADNLGEMSRQFANELIAAEASLAAAKERVALVQRCIGARMDRMTPEQRECAVLAAWWLLNDITGIRPASEKPEFVNREIAELVKDCADALKTAAGKE